MNSEIPYVFKIANTLELGPCYLRDMVFWHSLGPCYINYFSVLLNERECISVWDEDN